MSAMKKVTYFLAGFVVALIGAILLRNCGTSHGHIVGSDTITIVRHDTLRVNNPLPYDSTTLRRDTVRLPVVTTTHTTDTLTHIDSVLVALDITQKQYQGDGYKAWVSGYDPKLDSIFIDRQTTTQRITTAPKRCGLSISAGGAITPHGLQPYVGIGISYTILTF